MLEIMYLVSVLSRVYEEKNSHMSKLSIKKGSMTRLRNSAICHTSQLIVSKENLSYLTVTGLIFQISRAYSWIVRSLEK